MQWSLVNELTNLCGGGAAGSDLAALRAGCRRFESAFELPLLELVLLIAFALAGFVAVAVSRRGQGALIIILNGLEGAVYGALGFYAGSTFALAAALFVPPLWFAATVAVACLAALVFVIAGMVAPDADGDGGGKATALLLGLLLVGAGGAVLALAIRMDVPGSGPVPPQYEWYLNSVAVFLGVLGGIDGIITAGTRGVHWAVGWLLVPLNASWGFMGNILGLGNHLASYFCFGYGGASRGGGVQTARREVHQPCNLYKRGLTFKRVTSRGRTERFAFTQGWVVACEHGGDVEVHEVLHVWQHMVLGPLYPVSWAVWFVTGALLGIVAWIGLGLVGLFSAGARIHIEKAVTNMAYYNNPYEIMAYATHNGARNRETRLIFPVWAAVPVAILWPVGAVAGFLWLMLVYWKV